MKGSIHALPASLIGKMENDWKYDTPSGLIRDWPFVSVPTFDDNKNPYCAAVISEKTLNYLNTTDNPQGFKGTDDESRFLNARYYEIKPVDKDSLNNFDTDEGIWETYFEFPEYKYDEMGGHTPEYRFARMMMAFYLAKQSELNRAKIEEDFNNPLLVVDGEREGYKSMILHIWYLSMNWFIECPMESLDEAWLAFKNGTSGRIKDIKIYIENTKAFGNSTFLLNAWNEVFIPKGLTMRPEHLCELYIEMGLMDKNENITYGSNMEKYAEVVNPKNMSYGSIMGVINHYLFGDDLFGFAKAIEELSIPTKERFKR